MSAHTSLTDLRVLSRVGKSPKASHPTLEYLFLKVLSPRDSLLFEVIYKPLNALYGNELKSKIFSLIPYSKKFAFAGDFNTDLNASNNITKYLKSLVYSSGLLTVPHSNILHTNSAGMRIDLMIIDDLDKVL